MYSSSSFASVFVRVFALWLYVNLYLCGCMCVFELYASESKRLSIGCRGTFASFTLFYLSFFFFTTLHKCQTRVEEIVLV